MIAVKTRIIMELADYAETLEKKVEALEKRIADVEADAAGEVQYAKDTIDRQSDAIREKTSVISTLNTQLAAKEQEINRWKGLAADRLCELNAFKRQDMVR